MAKAAVKYKLRPVKAIPGKTKTSFYREILNEFVESDEDMAQVEIPDRKPQTIYQGLTKARSEGMKRSLHIRIRDNRDVYLEKSATSA